MREKIHACKYANVETIGKERTLVYKHILKISTEVGKEGRREKKINEKGGKLKANI